tara:strand:- start:712 stop:1074 length:363 start_codon:yes stop_codon:yes gene_type:complete
MKRYLALLLLSPLVHSETYICTFKYKALKNYPAKTQVHKFTRSGNKVSGEYFLHEVDYKKLANLNIYNEVFKGEESLDSYLILGKYFNVFKIDRERLKATEVVIYVNSESEIANGRCSLS